MAEEALLRVTLAIIIGTLAAIVYSLRILVLVERRVARMEAHIERLATKILKEELKIERKVSRTSLRKAPKKASALRDVRRFRKMGSRRNPYFTGYGQKLATWSQSSRNRKARKTWRRRREKDAAKHSQICQ